MGTPSNRYLRISGVDLRTAETLVDASGLPGWFADRAAGCRGNHGGGAPIRFSWRHLLIALALLAMSEQPMILRDAVRTCNALTRKQKTRLGLPARVTERMVSWRFNRLVDLIDPSPHSVRNRTRRAEMTGLYVLNAEGRPLLRQVRLGEARGSQIEILSGLRAGERVALEPQAAARVR